MTDNLSPSPSAPQRAFFLGVAGMGMAPLALFLTGLGCRVRGSDDGLDSGQRDWLAGAGVDLVGSEAFPEAGETVVYTSALRQNDHRLERARQLGCPLFRRGEMLAKLAAGYRLVAVAGSHGKTTTAGLLIHRLIREGLDFSYLLGARFRGDFYPPAQVGPSGGWLVAEVDESDGTIEHFHPRISLLVNLDWDHVDRYQRVEDLLGTFRGLAERTEDRVYLPESDAGRLAGLPEERLFPVALPNPVEPDFNRSNARLAEAVGERILGRWPGQALEGFPGISRRQDLLWEGDGLSILADYAHHPTELAALFTLLRSRHPGAALWVVFQPHRPSRTAAFARGFADVLRGVDQVFLLPVYAAGEAPREDGGSTLIQTHGDPGWELLPPTELIARLSRQLGEAGGAQPVVLAFVGAGDIDRVANDFVSGWRTRAELQGELSMGTRLVLNEGLARRTTLRVGGPARWFAEPASSLELATLLRQARALGLPVFFLGRGSNLIVSDGGFAGLVIALSDPAWQVVELLDGGRLRVGAGVRLKQLCAFAARQGLEGLEFLEGIPGTVGGALRMNAGALGGWIFDLVEAVHLVTLEGEAKVLNREDFHTGYRYCQELRGAVATEAVIRPVAVAEEAVIRRRMDSYADKRRESQPREPSAGCIFKNPEGDYAGRLVDELGLKGLSVGAAEVSQVHGNFIINRGGACGEDVIKLVREVRERIRSQRGILLEPEVLLVGKQWEEVLS